MRLRKNISGEKKMTARCKKHEAITKTIRRHSRTDKRNGEIIGGETTYTCKHCRKRVVIKTD